MKFIMHLRLIVGNNTLENILYRFFMNFADEFYIDIK